MPNSLPTDSTRTTVPWQRSVAGCKLLAEAPEIHLLATCQDGEQAIAAVHRFKPDVLLLDLSMPKKDGLTVLRELHEAELATKVIVLTAAIDDSRSLMAVQLGARGFVLKGEAPTVLMQCIHRVAAGGMWIDSATTSRMFDSMLRGKSAAERAQAAALTPRELELVQMVARGLRNKAIAERLAIQEGTVKAHLFHIYQKMGVRTRVELVLRSREAGIA